MTSKRILERKYAHAILERDRIEAENKQIAEKCRIAKELYENLRQELKRGVDNRKTQMIVIQNLYNELTSTGLFRNPVCTIKKPKLSLERPAFDIPASQVTPVEESLAKKARIELSTSDAEESLPGFSQGENPFGSARFIPIDQRR